MILVSHDIEIVQELADHYVILNRGTLVADARAKDMTPQKLVHLMAGLIETEQPDQPASLATT